MLKIFCFRSQSQRMRAYINNEDKFSFIHSLLYFPFIKVAVMQKVEEYFNHEDEINPFRYCSRPQYGNYVSIRRHNLMKGGSIQKVLVIHSFYKIPIKVIELCIAMLSLISFPLIQFNFWILMNFLCAIFITHRHWTWSYFIFIFCIYQCSVSTQKLQQRVYIYTLIKNDSRK